MSRRIGRLNTPFGINVARSTWIFERKLCRRKVRQRAAVAAVMAAVAEWPVIVARLDRHQRRR